MTGRKVNIQAVVEKPKLYMLARCPATDEQLSYVGTRVEDLVDLTDSIVIHGIPISDSMRFFKGDGPACQFEAGQQKGGHYKCWGCSVNVNNSHDFVSSSYQPLLSLADRQAKVMKSERSKLERRRRVEENEKVEAGRARAAC